MAILSLSPAPIGVGSMRPGHPFRALLRRLGFREFTPPRRLNRARLDLIELEDRVTPSNVPFTIDRPTGMHFFSATASDSQGNSVAVYMAQAPDSWNYDIYLQQIAPDGTEVGDPVMANDPDGGDHMGSAIAMAPDGDFVVSWYGAGSDTSGDEI